MIKSRPRIAILAVYAAFGAIVGTWAGSIPQIVAANGLSDFGLGFGLTVSTFAGVVAMGLGGAIGRRASNRMLILILLPTLWAFAALLLLSGSSATLYAGLIGFGVAVGLLDVFMNAEASAIETDVGRPIFTSFHASVSGGMAVFAIAGSLVSTLVDTWATAAMSAPLALVAWLLVRVSIPPRNRGAMPFAAAASRPNGALVVIGLAMGLIIATEMAAIFWSAKLLEEQAPRLAAIAGLGAAFFALCHMIMRMQGDRLRARFGDIALMKALLAMPLAGFLTLGLSSSFALSVAAFASIGFGLAIIVPCLLNIAAMQSPGNRAAALGFVFAVAGAPRIIAPWIFGLIAAESSTGAAFGSCAVIVVAAWVLITQLPRRLPHSALPA